MKTNVAGAAKNAKTKQAVVIALKDAIGGDGLKWNFPDMANGEYAITDVRVFDGVGKTSGKPYKAFEIEVDGRDEVIRVLPMRAVEYGIASIVDDGVEVTAQVITSNKSEENNAYELAVIS